MWGLVCGGGEDLLNIEGMGVHGDLMRVRVN